ncbi:MAG: 2-isopropylmalate synthase [Chloroflexi bacterium]|nr:2-isopropylmalate synthase [Chloroflexota bacterium]
MAQYPLNPDKVFHNYGGMFPPTPLEETPAAIPAVTDKTHPKKITDTTLRDGAQDPRIALFPIEARLAYYDLLHELDNGTGTIEQIEVFIYQKRDEWSLEQLLSRGYRYPEITIWTRATPKDIRLMVDVTQGKVKETGMLASSSDHHIFDKLRFRSKEQAIEAYLQPIMTACEHNITPRVHLEDTTKADIFGWVIPFMQRVLKETEGKAKFRICDTIGWGNPDPYGALPFGLPKLISTLHRETGAELEFHGHNDFGLATANSLAAWRYGCKRVNTAFAGLGERTGNTSLEQMLANYVRLYGDPGLRLDRLAAMADLIHRHVVEVSPKSPIIGDVFTTQAGLHQTGVARHEDAEGGLIYLACDPALLGREGVETNRIGSLSGMDGIVAVLNSHTGESHYTVTSRAVKHIYDAVQDAYDGELDKAAGKARNARISFFSAEEVVQLAQQYRGGRE